MNAPNPWLVALALMVAVAFGTALGALIFGRKR